MNLLSYFADEILLGVSEQHERKVVVDAVNRTVRQKCYHSADVGENPNGSIVQIDVISFTRVVLTVTTDGSCTSIKSLALPLLLNFDVQ